MKTTRLLIYLCPALMDWLFFLVNFAVLYRAGEQHLTLSQCAWLAGIPWLMYMFTSLATGFYLSRRNARAILLFSAGLTFPAIVLCLFASQFNLILIGMGATGMFSSLFFNAFQAFMRGESPPGGLMKTVSFYTFSWSLGIAFGFLSTGALYSQGVHALTSLAAVITLVIVVIAAGYKRQPLTAISAEEHVEKGPAGMQPVNARYVWIGWVIIFAAVFVQRPLVSFFPTISAGKGISSFMASLPLFLNYLFLALAGLAMIKWRRLLYRRFPLIIMQVMAAMLLFLTWQWPGFLMCLFSFSLLGIYFGFICFSSVYYSSNSGNRVLNVGINEFLCGIGSIGLFVSEWWMKYTANSASMYAVCGVTLSISVIILFLMAGPDKKHG